MELLTPPSPLVSFFANLRHAPARALLLDYDGTLAPFHVDRRRSFPYPEIHSIVQTILQANHTRVIIVSGRWSEDLLPLLRFDPLPEVWASHGHERVLSDGRYRHAPLDADAARALAGAYAAIVDAQLGDYCERKPASLALHWRGLDDDTTRRIRDLVERQWAQLDGGRHFRVLEFDGGVELCIRGRDKGAAVRTILSELPPAASVAYLGDDNTDEDAFKALRGHGLGVLVRPHHRATAADVWLRPPTELLSFLSEWHRAAEAR